MGYQLYKSFEIFGAQALVGGTIGVALFRELAPVLGAIMVTGRAGAGIGAEIASMRVSEQIDALEVMGVSPYEYLVMPRILAGMAMMPLLAFIFGGVATISASVIACGVLDLAYPTFWRTFRQWAEWVDLLQCLVKAITFGGVLTALGCFFGFRANGGARSVGFSTRSTVVASCLAILVLDYFWTMVLPLRADQLILR
jgi:phospholipid/cholesterol/gamma-HCH transport system permease protein